MENGILLCISGIEAIGDLKTHTIRSWLWGVVALLGALWNIAWNGQGAIWIVMAMLPGIFLLVCSKIMNGGVGLGDGIVFLAIGLWKGIEETSSILLFSLLLGGIWGIGQMIFKKKGKSDRMAFMPFVFLGELIKVVWI